MVLGLATHSLVNEPDKFDSEFAVEPVADGRTNAGKAIKAAFALTARDKTIITPDTFETAKAMANAVLANDEVHKLFQRDGDSEHAYKWNDKLTGLPCKAKPDRLIADFSEPLPILWELKTYGGDKSGNYYPTPEAFLWAIIRRGYHRQLWLYRSGVLATMGVAPRVHITVVSSHKPHLVFNYQLSEAFLALGEREEHRTMVAIKTCEQTGEWRSPGTQSVIELTPPKHILSREELDDE